MRNHVIVEKRAANGGSFLNYDVAGCRKSPETEMSEGKDSVKDYALRRDSERNRREAAALGAEINRQGFLLR